MGAVFILLAAIILCRLLFLCLLRFVFSRQKIILAAIRRRIFIFGRFIFFCCFLLWPKIKAPAWEKLAASQKWTALLEYWRHYDYYWRRILFSIAAEFNLFLPVVFVSASFSLGKNKGRNYLPPPLLLAPPFIIFGHYFLHFIFCLAKNKRRPFPPPFLNFIFAAVFLLFFYLQKWRRKWEQEKNRQAVRVQIKERMKKSDENLGRLSPLLRSAAAGRKR